MSRYIDADRLLKALNTFRDLSIFRDKERGDEHFINGIRTAISQVEWQPTADVEEVRHGKWEHGCEIRREYIGDALVAIYYDKWWCSQCHYTIDDHHYSKITYKRCPECGAHMDKE